MSNHVGATAEIGGRSALAEAAERFEKLVRAVKDQQLAETRGPKVALNEAYTASPEEMWARKFMTQSIGPATTSSSAPALPALSSLGQTQFTTTTMEAVSQRTSAVDVGASRPGGDLRDRVAAAPQTQPALRRRTWLGWLFLGR